MTDKMSKLELLAAIQKGWEELQVYLDTLTEAQLTQTADAAGWTVKDHLIHLAVWEDGTVALLNGQSRRGRMGVDEAIWLTQEYDNINDVIYQTHRAKSLSEVMQTFNDVHQHMLEKLESMSDEDIYRPHSFYQQGSTNERPIIVWIIASTYEHYIEHMPWITAIVTGS
jgi:hypothetical protein